MKILSLIGCLAMPAPLIAQDIVHGPSPPRPIGLDSFLLTAAGASVAVLLCALAARYGKMSTAVQFVSLLSFVAVAGTIYLMADNNDFSDFLDWRVLAGSSAYAASTALLIRVYLRNPTVG